MRTPISGIYCWVNLVNGKRYAGMSHDMVYRRGKHLQRLRAGTHPNPHLLGAFHKYGEAALSFVVVCLADRGSLHALEIEYVKAFKSDDRTRGYNISPGGLSGFPCSAETKFKLSIINRGRKQTLETRRKISEASRGHACSVAQREAISKANTGKKRSAEAREKMSIAKKGKPLSLETRKKIGDKSRGRTHKCSDESRRRMSESRRGRTASAETKAKMSIASRGRKLSGEVLERRRERLRSPEFRKKLSEAQTRRRLREGENKTNKTTHQRKEQT